MVENKESEMIRVFEKVCPHAAGRAPILPDSHTEEDWDPLAGMSDRMGRCVCHGMCGERTYGECCFDPRYFLVYFNLAYDCGRVGEEISLISMSYMDRNTYHVSENGVYVCPPGDGPGTFVPTVEEFIDILYENVDRK